MSKKGRAVPAAEARANVEGIEKQEAGFLDILGITDATVDQDPAADSPVVEIEKGAAKDLLTKLAPALSKLTDAVAKAKDLGDKPMPADVQKSIGEVASALKACAGADAKAKADGAGSLASAVAKLTAVVDQVKKAGDGDAPDVGGDLAGIAASLEDLLAKQAKKDAPKPTQKADDEPSTFEIFKAAGSGGDDPEVIIKVGSKMKKSRLSQLKKAISALSELVAELEGGSSQQTTKSKSAVDLTPVLSRIDEFASAVKTRFEAIEGGIGEITKRVDTIENTRPAGNGDGDPPASVSKSDDKANLWAGIL